MVQLLYDTTDSILTHQLFPVRKHGQTFTLITNLTPLDGGMILR
jgi:hypothetical protein